MSKYQSLKDALGAPGLSDFPWDAFGPSNDAAPPDYYDEVVAVRSDAQVQVICQAPRGLDGACTADMAYIAKANPATVRALLADLERAEKALAAIAQQAQPVHQFRRRLCADWYDGHPDHEDGGGPYETRILYTTPPAPQVPVDELPDLNPEDFVVDVVLKQIGGFAPVTTHGVRVTHKPSHISVVVDSERSQHRNRQLALEALRAIIHHQAHPVPSLAASAEDMAVYDAKPAPQAGEVTDEQIDAATRHIYHNGRPTTKEYRVGIVRAILALRPQAVPMTDEQAWHSDTLMAANGIAGFKMDALMRIVRAVEAHHGITAKE